MARMSQVYMRYFDNLSDILSRSFLVADAARLECEDFHRSN